MSRVITFSRTYPSYHPRAGELTRFIEKIYAGLADIEPGFKIPNDANAFWDWYEYYNCVTPKFHTIRAGHRWKVGDKFSPRIWSGIPYRSKMITIGPDIEIEKIWNFRLCGGKPFINNYRKVSENKLSDIAKNDGLSKSDFISWFYDFSRDFDGQILCWNKNIQYL